MSGVPLRRKLAAILSADVVGYSAMMAQDEESTLSRLAQCREVIDGLVLAYHGRIVGTAGDSVLAEFPSAVDAVRAATEIQDALKTRNNAQPPNRQMLFRIGINVGDVIVQGDDLLGDGVNVAARIQSLAEPGGISVSATVYDQVQNKLTVSFGYDGEYQLKNIPRPVHVFRLESQEEVEAATAKALRRANDIQEEAEKAAVPDYRQKASPKPPAPPKPPREWPKIDLAAKMAAIKAPLLAAGSVLTTSFQRLGQTVQSMPTRTRAMAGGGVAVVVLAIGVIAFVGHGATDQEQALWEQLGNTGRIEDLTAFLATFADGHYATEAREKLEQMQKAEAEKQAEPLKTVEVEKQNAQPVPKPRERKRAEKVEVAPTPVEAPAPAPVVEVAPADPKLRFDGHWRMVSECQALPGDKGFTDEREIAIQGGKFSSVMTKPDNKTSFEGSVTPEGTISARGHSQERSGLLPLQLRGKAEGDKKFSGEFWWDKRLCYTTLTKG